MSRQEKKLPRGFWIDQKWIFTNYDKLARQYANKWIAVVNKRVVTSGNSISAVKRSTYEKTKRSPVPIMFIEKGINIYAG